MRESRTRELSVLDAYISDYTPKIQDRQAQLDMIHAFFMADRPKVLTTLLPGRQTWFKKYAAVTMTARDVNTLAAFIERLEDNEALIAEEITAYRTRHGIDHDITFSEFVNQFDADGTPVKSIVSTVLRNAAKRKALAEKPRAKKLKK